MATVTTGALEQIRRTGSVLLLAILLSACGPDPKLSQPAPAAQAVAASVNEAETVRFVADHWARPLAPQCLMSWSAWLLPISPIFWMPDRISRSSSSMRMSSSA